MKTNFRSEIGTDI